MPQNFQGELLTDIRDTGADPNDPSTRLYKTRAEQDFHTDGADVIGLLCLRRRQARRREPHRQLGHRRQRDPAAASRAGPLLFRDFYWHYFEPQMPSPVHFVAPDLRASAAAA